MYSILRALSTFNAVKVDNDADTIAFEDGIGARDHHSCDPTAVVKPLSLSLTSYRSEILALCDATQSTMLSRETN